MELQKGRTYYVITFADRDFTMPGIDPVVYIGKNAFIKCLENDRDTYQFQDTVSFVRFGYVMDIDSQQKEECQVEAFDEDQLGKDITTLEGAAEMIKDANSRSKELGHPVLSIAKGKWITAQSETWVEIDDKDKGEESV